MPEYLKIINNKAQKILTNKNSLKEYLNSIINTHAKLKDLRQKASNYQDMYINNKEKHDKHGNIVSTIDQINHLDDENDNKEMNHPIWIGADKYKEVLDNAKSFSHKNKIGKFRFVDVYNLIDEIKDNKSDELSIKNEYNDLNNILNK